MRAVLVLAFVCAATALSIDADNAVSGLLNVEGEKTPCDIPRSFPANVVAAPNENGCVAGGSIESGTGCKLRCATGYSWKSGKLQYQCTGSQLVDPELVCEPASCALPSLRFGTLLTTGPKDSPTSQCVLGTKLEHGTVCDVTCPDGALITNGGTTQYVCNYGVLTVPTATCYSVCTIPKEPFQSVDWVRGVLPTNQAGGCKAGDILLPGETCNVQCPTNPDYPAGWVTSAGDLFYKCSDDGNLIFPTATCQGIPCPIPEMDESVYLEGVTPWSEAHDTQTCSLCATGMSLTCYNFCRLICAPGFKTNPDYAPGKVTYLQCFAGQLYIGAPSPYHPQDNPCFKQDLHTQGHYLRNDWTREKMGIPFDGAVMQPCIPIVEDCVGSWSNPSDCSVTCGTGVQTQTYTITSPAVGSGAKCPEVDGATREVECGAKVCPVDCEGEWGSPSECTATCDGGSYTQTYTHISKKVGSGASCVVDDGETRTLDCGQNPCPVDCVGEWSDYGDCDASCGGGRSVATFTVTQRAENGGAQCQAADGDEDFILCGSDACPVDCAGQFDDWSSCGATCGGDSISHTFHVSREAVGSGAACDFEDGFVQTRPCAETPCPVDCEGSFDEFTDCSQTCGGGFRTRRFTVTQDAAYDGEDCDYSNGEIDYAKCSQDSCPVLPPHTVDCEGSWSEFGGCSQSCDGGQKSRIYTITVAKDGDGAECEAADGDIDTKSCGTDSCPIDCIGNWSDFSSCDVTCGGSTHTQTYTILRSAQFGGLDCPEADGATVEEACGTDGCPVDCDGDFGGFDDCPVTCGGGIQTAVFQIVTAAANGGIECNHKDGDVATKECGNDACPIDCEGAWGTYSDCTATCNTGAQSRRFSVSIPAQHGGAECGTADGAEEVIPCGLEACPVDCAGSWSDYSDCDVTCGAGVSYSTFTVTQVAKNGGADCQNANKDTRTQECFLPACEDNTPTDCVGSWSEFTDCDATCGGSTQFRSYIITVPALNGGEACPHNQGDLDSKECATEGCPVDCVGAWEEWTRCTRFCGGGETERTYRVRIPAENGGVECEAKDGHLEKNDCGQVECPADCVGRWDEGQCSKLCGGGKVTRTYHIILAAIENGEECPYAEGETDEADCNTQECAKPPTPSPTPAPTPAPGPHDCSCGCNDGCHSSCCPASP